MSQLRLDDLKLFISTHKHMKDKADGCASVFTEDNRRILKSIHKGLLYFGPEYYCFFSDGVFVCKMSGKDIEELAEAINQAARS